MTLRARLTLALVILMAAGLLAADAATYASFRSFLIRRVDQQLVAARVPAAYVLREELAPDPNRPGPPDAQLPSGTYVAYVEPSGTIHDKVIAYGGTVPAKPALPDRPGGDPFTTGSVGGGPRYRVQYTPLEQGGFLIVGIPLTEVTQTLGRLLAVASIVTILVLLAMAGVSWYTVRRELRPFEEIEATAGAIAAGDLSRRVERTDPRTEVGRLGSSLNVMLGRIEGAMEEVRASEASLRRFLADASHELRTPLTSIRGYAELFRRGAAHDPDDTALAMRRIEQESERMGLLVEDLLFLARSGQGRPIAHEPVDLAAVVTDAVQDARTVDPARPIGLTAPSQLQMLGDEPRLRQVLANLLSNALTHTPEGTPVAVSLSEDGDDAIVEIRDAGPGLEAAEASQVFDAFFRADPVRERRAGSEGTGLGLAIVAAIAEAHGGSARVVSAPGEGAAFEVRLPRTGRDDGTGGSGGEHLSSADAPLPDPPG
jgi:two-component system, OmpR family, sensor kinase